MNEIDLIESRRIELKQYLTDSLEKEVVAFLNYHEDGVIYIGVDGHGKILGCEDADDIQLKIKDRLKHNISPSCLWLFEIILEKHLNKNIIKIIVASGRETPYYIKKQGMSSRGCFIRIGSSSEPMSQTMIKDLFAKRVRNSLSKIQSHRQDLGFEQLKIYYQEKGLGLKERVETPLWNKIALREAVINAIVHNDYTTELPPVFEIYSDRIEITSSGGISTIKNMEDFFTGYSKPINRELMRIYKDLELVEHLGSGLGRILEFYGKDSFVVSQNFMKNILNPLLENELLVPTISDKPKSPNQKYKRSET